MSTRMVTIGVARGLCAVSVIALLIGGACPAAGDGAVSHRAVAVTGDPAPGTDSGVVFGSLTTPVNPTLLRPRIDESGNVAFMAFLDGPGVDGSNGSGVWAERGGQLSLVARKGDPAPGAEPGVTFAGFPDDFVPSPPRIAGGRAGFFALLAGPGVDVTTRESEWLGRPGDLALLARSGMPAPGMEPGIALVGARNRSFNASGHAVVFGRLSGDGVAPGTAGTLWSNRSGELVLVAREGDPAPGLPPGVVFGQGHLGSFGVFTGATINAQSEIGIVTGLLGPGTNSFNDEAIFVERAGQFVLLAREGDPVPGVPGVTFGGNSVSWQVTNLTFADSGRAAFMARIGGASPTRTAIFTDRSGQIEMVVREGDPAPGTGDSFEFFGNLRFNSAGDLAFVGALPDGDGVLLANDFGVWWDVGGDLAPLVLPGDTVPGGFTVTGKAVSIAGFNDAGQLVLAAAVRDSAGVLRSGRFFVEPDGTVHPIVVTGEGFDVGGDGTDVRTVSRIVAGGFNGRGEFAFRLDFTDGSGGHFVAALTPACPPDWNGDGVVDSDDLLDFLADWGAGDADYNGDGVTDSDDLLEFLADWSAGC